MLHFLLFFSFRQHLPCYLLFVGGEIWGFRGEIALASGTGNAPLCHRLWFVHGYRGPDSRFIQQCRFMVLDCSLPARMSGQLDRRRDNVHSRRQCIDVSVSRQKREERMLKADSILQNVHVRPTTVGRSGTCLCGF
jgi:hypothetical protein